jgi:hypothetical protein
MEGVTSHESPAPYSSQNVVPSGKGVDHHVAHRVCANLVFVGSAIIGEAVVRSACAREVIGDAHREPTREFEADVEELDVGEPAL